jgi:hypothetical protein
MIDFMAIDSSQHPIAPLIRIFMRSLPLLRPVVLSGESVTGRSLLAQFGLTPKSRLGLAAVQNPGRMVSRRL